VDGREKAQMPVFGDHRSKLVGLAAMEAIRRSPHRQAPSEVGIQVHFSLMAFFLVHSRFLACS